MGILSLFIEASTTGWAGHLHGRGYRSLPYLQHFIGAAFYLLGLVLFVGLQLAIFLQNFVIYFALPLMYFWFS